MGEPSRMSTFGLIKKKHFGYHFEFLFVFNYMNNLRNSYFGNIRYSVDSYRKKIQIFNTLAHKERLRDKPMDKIGE